MNIIIKDKINVNEVKIFSILKLFKPKFLYIINSFFSKILIKKNWVEIRNINGKIL